MVTDGPREMTPFSGSTIVPTVTSLFTKVTALLGSYKEKAAR